MVVGNKFGRWADQASVDRYFGSKPSIKVSAFDVLSAADDDADIDLCLIYEKHARKPWNSRNQNPRGFCVGFGNAKDGDIVLATAAEAGELDFPGDVAVEPVYGGMRYEIGAKTHGSDINRGGDGGVGTWAVEWFQKYGLLLMKQYGSIDFTQYSMDRCDKYGRSGVPDELEPEAKTKPIRDAVLLDDADQAWKMIGQLHGLVHCSDQGFAMQRNSDGTCKANDVWPHCANFFGRFTMKNGEKVLRYDNHWNGRPDGAGYLGNPIVIDGKNGPIHLNGNQFLVPLDIVNRIIKNGRETYSLSGPQGFTVRRPLLMI